MPDSRTSTRPGHKITRLPYHHTPRSLPDFQTASFKDGVHAITDLDPGMKLEGVVTNVTAFGAFVDIGVHQDGLVHISQLSDRFVDSPRDVVKAGDVVQVRVLDVDLEQKRISLSMKSPADAVTSPASRKSPSAPARKAGKPAPQPQTSSPFDVLKILKP